MTLYYEDLTVGEEREPGSFSLSAAAIVDFAESYDPQPMHADPDAAAEGPFDGLVASGWHTASATMRVLVDGFLDDAATRGALGVDELRWPAPLRPDERVTVTVSIAEKQPSESDPDRGIVVLRVTGVTESSTVLSYEAIVLFDRRAD